MATRILQWLAASAILFLLIVTVLLLGGVAAPEAAQMWLSGPLPDWIQAFATAFAAYVAWAVFHGWREAELAKARALHAPRVLASLKPYKDTVTAARFGLRPYDFPLAPKWLKEALSERRAKAIAALREPLRALEDISEETADPETGALIDHLIDIGHTLIGAWQTVQELTVDRFDHKGEIIDDEPITFDIRDEEEFGAYFQILGLRRRHQRGDAFGADFNATAQRLRTLLRHHMSYSAPPRNQR